MMSWHDRWHTGHPVFALLLPLSLLFTLLILIRRLGYRLGLLSVWRAPVPVIVVGNLSVGGTGKTPLTLALVDHLKRAGWRPGIVSRGHGGQTVYPARVQITDAARHVGDEPLLLARRSGVPVVVDPRRAQAVRHLLATSDCNVVICDDGLQHYALARDLEIAVLDGARGLGHGWLLPAGPLREPRARLARCDFRVCNGAWTAAGTPPTDLVSADLVPGIWQPVSSGTSVTAPPQPGTTVRAIAAIGNPVRFFSLLERLGYRVLPQAFPDHHAYAAADLRSALPHPLVMTEKDAVKCAGIAPANSWYLPVQAELPDTFWQAVLARLASWRP